jgi:hypothetical protein
MKYTTRPSCKSICAGVDVNSVDRRSSRSGGRRWTGLVSIFLSLPGLTLTSLQIIFFIRALTSTPCGGAHLTQWIGTGEVGIEKKECLYEDLGEGTVELMRTVKNAIDRMGLRTPEKYALIAMESLSRF